MSQMWKPMAGLIFARSQASRIGRACADFVQGVPFLAPSTRSVASRPTVNRQNSSTPFRQHDVADFAAFAPSDSNRSSVAIKILNF